MNRLAFACAIFAAIISSPTPARALKASSVCEAFITQAAETFGVPAGLLYAVARAETAQGGSLSPFALNIEGVPVLAASKAEAEARFKEAYRSGKQLIDIGCMQVNFRYHRSAFASLDEMLEPRANVFYAAKFLKSLRSRHGSWTAAVAHYHASPRNKSAQRRYVCRVVAHLVATGFGAWTPDARALCKGRS